MSSIKQRVFLLFGSFTLLLSLVFSGITLLIAYVIEDELIERVLQEEANVIAVHYVQQGALPELRNPYMRIYRDKADLPTEVQEVLSENPKAREIFTSSSTHYHLAYIPLDQQQSPILLAEVTPLLVVTNMSQRLLALFIAVVFGAFIIATYFAYRISRYSVLPIIQLTEELKRQKDQKQLVLPEYNDEVGFLSRTLEENLNQLQQALSREKHFTRDVSHELRTPLTVIKNTLSLAENRDLQEKDIQQILSSSQEIENTIEVLFMLARAESLDVENCHVNAIIEDVLLGLYPQIEAASFDIQLDTDDNVRVSTNPALLKLLLNNIILNALQHSDTPCIDIVLKEACLSVSNASNEKEFEISENSFFEPGIKSKDSAGLGQGLFLISRIAEAMNWRLHLVQQDNTFSISVNMSR